MHADVRLSTSFHTTQNAHQVGVLVSLAGDRPVRRAVWVGSPCRTHDR
jgi:hypothetical protein